MKHRTAALLLCLLHQSPLAWPQLRQVEDLRCPGPGITSLRYEQLYGRPERPAFVGDVDGDGFDDFLLYQTFGDSQSRTLLVYGQARYPSEATLDDVRTTVFLHPLREIITFGGSLSPYHPAGDVDGDGKSDFFVGSPLTDWNGVPLAGQALLVYGSAAYGPEVSLDSPPTPGVRLKRFISTEERFAFGWEAAPAGDLDGDGFLDVAITTSGGAGSANGIDGAGRLYLFLGDAAPPGEDDVLLEDLGGSVGGFVLHGAYGPDQGGGHNNGDFLGYAVIGPGDLNGDGLDDLVVSAPHVSRGGLQERGAAYVVYGRETFPSDLYIEDPGLFGAFGVEILGRKGMHWFGRSIASVGDVDGDGLRDFVVGAPSPGGSARGFHGELYLIYGSRDWPASIDVGDEAFRVFRLSETRPLVAPGSAALNAVLGVSVTGVGDWNNDGYPDFAAGAPEQYQRLETHVGAAYIVHGGPGLPRSATDLEVGTRALPGEVFTGPGTWRSCGHGVAGGGDLDGDGSTDFLIKAPDHSVIRPLEPDLGTLYIVRGARFDGGAWSVCEVSPPQGSIRGGDRVAVRGSGFLGTERVRFADVEALTVEATSRAEIIVAVPPAAAEGFVDVEVVRGADRVHLPAAFRYHRPSPYSDVTLDAALGGDSPRTLEIRQFPGRTFSNGVRQFAAVYFADLNGDSLDDLIIAAQYDGEAEQGEVNVVFGSRDLPATLEWSEIPSRGFVIAGDPGQLRFGITIALPGDVDEDSFPDLAVGGARDRSGTGEQRVAYVIRGRSEWEPRLDLAEEVAAERAVAIPLVETCGSPHVEMGGDLAGTGIPALIVGGAGCHGERARIEVHAGGIVSGQPLPLPAVITGDPEMLHGIARSLGDITLAGDLNGDGHLDIAAGSLHMIEESLLLLGGDWSFREASVLDFLAEGRGVRIRRELFQSQLGHHHVPAGDFNGDGLDDLLIGLPGGGADFHGEAYILFGSPDLGATVRDLDLRAEGPWRMRFDGEYSDDRAGWVAGLGDLNGDGYSDLGIVPTSSLSPSSRAYVILGEADPPERLHLGSLGERGFTIRGIEGHWFSGGFGPMAAGDMDGDGFQDIAIGEHTPQGKRVVVIFGVRPSSPLFFRGDANDDGRTDITDAVFTLGYLFLGGPAPPCEDAADADDQGTLEITDAVFVLNYLFSGGEEPPPPHGIAEEDPTPDGLGCRGFP